MYCKCSTGSWDPYLEIAGCAADCSGESTTNYLGVCSCGVKVWDGIFTNDCAVSCPENSTADSKGICKCND